MAFENVLSGSILGVPAMMAPVAMPDNIIMSISSSELSNYGKLVINHRNIFNSNLPSGELLEVNGSTLERWYGDSIYHELAEIPLVDTDGDVAGYMLVTMLVSDSNVCTIRFGLYDTDKATYLSDGTNLGSNVLIQGGPNMNLFDTNSWVRVYLFEYTSNDTPCIGFYYLIYSNGYYWGQSPSWLFDFDRIQELLNIAPNYEEYSEEFGPASDEEGYTGGSFDDSSDTIDIPDMPSLGVTNAGFVHLYEVSNQELTNFGGELFPAFSGISIPTISTPTDVTDAVYQMAEAIAAIGNNIGPLITVYINKSLIDYVLDCHIIPVAPTTGTRESITVGWRILNTAADRVSSDYVDFDCGSLSIQEYYGNYIDYAGTKAKLFLPFVGYVELEPEYWQSGTISVKYRFNVIDGSFQAYVLSTSSKSNLTTSVIGQYGGNCIVHIPITGLNYSNIASAAVSAVAAPVMTAAKGGAVGTSAASSAADVINARPAVQSSNGYSSSSSFLSGRTPYLIIEREVSSFSTKYPDEQGLPLNVTKTLGSVSGFTIASDIILDGVTATETELDQIRALFSEGVIL